jgi:hypothetical protein
MFNGEKTIGSIHVLNKNNDSLIISISTKGEITDLIKFNKIRYFLERGGETDILYTIQIPEDTDAGVYTGEILLKGQGFEKKVPIEIRVSERKEQLIELTTQSESRTITPGDDIKVNIKMNNPLEGEVFVNLYMELLSARSEMIVSNKSEDVLLSSYYAGNVKLSTTQDLALGEYIIRTIATYTYLNVTYTVRDFDSVNVEKPFFERTFYGISVMQYLFGVLICTLLALSTYAVIRHIRSQRKYQNEVNLKELPKPGPKSAFVGHIVETNIRTFVDLDKLQTHTIVAGATGGGKSVAAQVIIEEALDKGVAVIVFDPTAQWSGFLRKSKERVMLKKYHEFSMKYTDARAFNGNIRSITNANEYIEIKKYIKAGEINIFTINKLNSSEADMFVANSIQQVFEQNLEESQQLKLLLVYDEVHRLLPKFGASGAGFIQIERACREFRKWGVGLMLISQVLSDFVGEIKANINTEIQMRTRDEHDLERLKIKYGENVVQNVLRASVGAGMLQNAEYNKGHPYFVQFRPLLHSISRLSDVELEKYTKYNTIIDDLEYQIVQFEEEKQDVFDLKLELKLATDKLKQGSFNMVDIYLEGLTPRIIALWAKIGKQPKKHELKLVDYSLILQGIERARKDRVEFEKKEKEQLEKLEAEKKQDTLVASVDDKKEEIIKAVMDNGVKGEPKEELKKESKEELKKESKEELKKEPKMTVVHKLKTFLKKNIKNNIVISPSDKKIEENLDDKKINKVELKTRKSHHFIKNTKQNARMNDEQNK